jgi:hypothetical protein
MLFIHPMRVCPIILGLFCNPLFSQNAGNFEYIITCLKDSKIDSSQKEIKGIGKVQAINLEATELKETGLSYYKIPLKTKVKPAARLARLAADQYIQTWKNNSRVELNEEFSVENSSVVDLRLHLLIEDIYVQIIVICDKENIYEIICFRDTNDNPHFDALSKKIKNKSCLQ